jgi:hypothetical protein
MRRTEFLITELRKSTDNTDTNGVKDAEIIAYLNSGQRLIQNIIFKTNPKADIFKRKVDYVYSISGEYELPTDIFAENALSTVEYKQNGEYFKIDRIDEVEKRAGYYTEDKKLIVIGYQFFDIRVTIFRELPRMDKRWGKVSAVNSGVSLVLTGNDVTASEVDDSISVVNKFGAQVRSGIYIDGFGGATWTTTDALTGVAVNDYVCMGANSVNASELPNACETYLLDYVRQRIYTRNNYEDANKQAYFTDSQRADISDLFKNNQKDNIFPPITDFDALDFD